MYASAECPEKEVKETVNQGKERERLKREEGERKVREQEKEGMKAAGRLAVVGNVSRMK